MKLNVARWTCLALGAFAMVVWLCFNNPLVTLLVVVFWIAGEVVLWWGLYERKKG
jgi:hypothetical protein